ncbi:heparin lyase I family protein [Archangium primigenium]|uniref:heparin lyase I family protein n=1 Tax=[Archangium] primigenium TaxID=2792470 RepID=UPI00195C5A52|nr:heparin lyase I family protein [Archangium primigenium]
MNKTSLLARFSLALALTACGGSDLSGTTDSQPTSTESEVAGLTVQNCTALTPLAVKASGDDGAGSVAANSLDDRLDTRWSALGKGAWIDYDLGTSTSLKGAAIAWHQGHLRANTFTLSTSTDGSTYTPVYSGQSTGKTVEAETYTFTARTARYLRITVQGNTLNDWASIAEARGCRGSTASTVVWRADYETGDRSQWDREQMVSSDRLQVTTSAGTLAPRQGRYALKATVRQGDNPINSSGNRNELVKMTNEPSGSEYYYRWSTMFDPTFPSVRTWQLFTQWHHSGNSGSPPVEFYVYGEEVRLNIGGDPGVIVWKTPLVRGKWHDFVFHVKWSAKASEGFVELYYNGALVLPKRYIATQFSGQVNYLKLGLYRSDTVTQTGIVYHDDWVMARTLEDVL